MNHPQVSVIIPVYNGANFLGETIQSVLDQTYPNFELIVVNDASTDHSGDVVKQFNDPRLTYIVHEKNKGSEAARNTGLAASTGEIVIFLDQDDLIHPEKLEAHVTFMESHPDIGVTYNARFELNHSSTTIRDIWRPPANITLADLVLGFPLAPSEVVFRRKWALEMDLLKGSLSWCGGEIIHYSRLYLSGCKFARINRALNYRRHHSGRIIKDLVGGCQAEIYAQDKIFSDPRCPPEILALRGVAHKNTYLMWAYRALVQEETVLGQEFLRKAAQSKSSVLRGMPCELVNFMLTCSIDDEKQDHEILLKKIFTQLPPEMTHLSSQYDWAVARGYLIKGVRAIIWDRLEDGRRHLGRAAKLQGHFDESFLSQLTHYLINYEIEFGERATLQKMQALVPDLEKLWGRASVRKLVGSYAVNRAFDHYHTGAYAKVPRNIVPAIVNDPKYLMNRGVWSIFFRSILGMWIKSAQISWIC